MTRDKPEGKELWPFQRASVAYALERPHAFIVDQPGLGKTMSAPRTLTRPDKSKPIPKHERNKT